MKKIFIAVFFAAFAMLLTGCGGCDGKLTTNTMPATSATAASTSRHSSGEVTDKDGFIGNEGEENKTTAPELTLFPDMSSADDRVTTENDLTEGRDPFRAFLEE